MAAHWRVMRCRSLVQSGHDLLGPSISGLSVRRGAAVRSLSEQNPTLGGRAG
jgi:hypothetical protein